MKPRSTLVVALGLLLSRESLGQSTEAEREAMIRRAWEHRERGDHAAALEAARRAGAIRMTPGLYRFLAEEFHAVGRHEVQAFNTAERCLRAAQELPSGTARTEQERACRTVRDVAEARLGAISLRLPDPPPAGLRVLIAGEEIPPRSWNQPVRVEAGTVSVSVRTEDGRRFERTLDVAPRSAPEVEVTFPVPLSVTASRTIPSVPEANVPSREVPAPRASGAGRVLAWTALAGAGLSLGVGVWGLVTGTSAADRWNSDDCLAGGLTRETNCGEDGRTADTMRSVAIAGFVSAGALAAVSVVLFAVSGGRSAERGEGRASLSCGPGPGALGVSCGARF